MRGAAGGRALGREVGRFVRANLSSSAATALDWVVVTSAVWLGLHYLGAAAAGAAAGAVTDFALKRHWAFGGSGKRAVHVEGIRYLGVSGLSLALNLGLSWALVGVLGLPAVPGVLLASVAVGFGWNYPLHRLFVFRRAAPGVALAAEADAGAGTGAGEA